MVLTSDNPRSEDPLGIMNDAMVGIRRFDTPHEIEPDREKAIRRAIESAGPGRCRAHRRQRSRDVSDIERQDRSI